MIPMYQFGEWSQAGVMLTITGGGKWRCEIPRKEWSDDPEVIKAILADFEEPWGDRRQEIVMIGTEMRSGGEKRLQKALDACLLDDQEWAQWKKIMNSVKKGLRTMEQKAEALEEYVSSPEKAKMPMPYQLMLFPLLCSSRTASKTGRTQMTTKVTKDIITKMGLS
jgi:hypothetical protein